MRSYQLKFLIFKENFLRAIILSFYLLIVSSVSFSQVEHRFVPINTSQGLSQNSVHCIFQDSDGLLWLGTQDGLNSFNGRDFKIYRYNPADTNSLSDHFILSITEDANGMIWVGTGSGLNKLNKRTGKITRYYLNPNEKNKVSANYALLVTNEKKDIFLQHDNNLVMITATGDMFVTNNVLQKSKIIAVDSESNIWAIRNTNTMMVLSKSSGYKNAASYPAPAKEPNSLATSWKGTAGTGNILWLYTQESNGRILFFDTKNKTWLQKQITLPTAINHIQVTKDGTGWVSTLTGIFLVKHFEIEKQLTYPGLEKNNMLPGSILYSYEDKQGYIWIGSANAGFAYHHPTFNNYKLTGTGIDNNAVTSAIETGNIQWLGTTSGLFRYDKSNKMPGIFFAGKRIQSITTDRQNNTWVAVQNDGLYILNRNAAILKSYKQQDSMLATKNILRLFTDSRDRIFVCTETGYFVFSSVDKWKSFYQNSQPKTVTGWYTLNAYEDSHNNIWLCKHLGIDVLDENLQLIKQISSQYASSPIKRSIITACTEDKNGDTWIATLRSGIYKYHAGTYTQYTTSDGLTSNLVYGITCDDKGRIWSTSPTGINVFVPAEKRFYPLSSHDGLPDDEFLLCALYKNEYGQLLAGSSKGLITINTNNINLQRKKIAARVNDVLVNGESIDRDLRPFMLKPGYSTISFSFSINESVQPKNIYYQYRVAELNSKWNNLSPENLQITYSNLPYQKLTMQVRAAYSTIDLETSAIDEFHFEVLAPFWKTTWFKIAASLLLAALIFFLVQVYNKRKYRQRLQALQTQKELQQERSRISRDLHDNIGAYTSALLAGLQQLKTNNLTNEETIDELNDYAANIMGYLRETIWVLNNEKLTLTAFADRFKNYASRITRHYPELSVRFNIEIKQERELKPQVSLNLFRILQEALQNACKHAAASEIIFSVTSHEKIICSVSDNGNGMEKDTSSENHGLGNMKARSQEIGFLFSIRFLPGMGTTISIDEK